MKTVRILVSMPVALKTQLDALRHCGYTVSGFIRNAVERELKRRATGQKAR